MFPINYLLAKIPKTSPDSNSYYVSAVTIKHTYLFEKRYDIQFDRLYHLELLTKVALMSTKKGIKSKCIKMTRKIIPKKKIFSYISLKNNLRNVNQVISRASEIMLPFHYTILCIVSGNMN